MPTIYENNEVCPFSINVFNEILLLDFQRENYVNANVLTKNCYGKESFMNWKVKIRKIVRGRISINMYLILKFR